jgi:cell division septation protein DedD
MRRSFNAMLCLLGLLLPGGAAAQLSPVDRGVLAAIDRARGMTDRGAGVAARRLLDSLVQLQPSGSDESAEALYWRAVLADGASEAERDWKQLAIEAPLSPRMPDALLWLGELAQVRGHHAESRRHLERLLQDYRDIPQRPKAMLWIARGYFEEGERAQACATIASLQAAPLPEGEIRMQAAELANRCANAASRAVAVEPVRAPAAAVPDVSVLDSVVAPSTPNRARFGVQLAAYDTRAEATRMVKRLAARGVAARIDGTRKPFRVRAGRYDSEAAAKSALAALQKRGMNGFVAEITP